MSSDCSFGFRALEDTPVRSINPEGEGPKDDIHIWIRGEAGPSAVMRRMGSGSRTGSHFHRLDQFQLCFGSPGVFFQRRDVPPGTVLVHYADAYAVYGPFGSDGPGTLDLLVIRTATDGVTGYMPGSEHLLMREAPRRKRVHSIQVGEMPTKGELVTEDLISEPDGLRCTLITGGPEAVMGSEPVPQGGRYHCVLAGEVDSEGHRFGPKALAWTQPSDASPHWTAAPGTGFQVLLMQFPAQPSVPLPTPMQETDWRGAVESIPRYWAT
jgi:hypothetical protein